MSIAIPPGFAQASWVFTGPLGTSPYVTTLGFDLTDRTGSYQDVANHLFNVYVETLLSTTNDALTLSKVTLLIGQDGGSGSVDSTNAVQQGGNSSNMAAIAMAPIVRKVTPTLGRSGRGRMFIPGALGDTDVDDGGNLDQTFRNGLQGAMNDFLELCLEGQTPGGSVAGPCQPVLLHAEGSDLLPSTILSFSVAPQVGWIRKRLR